MFSQCLTLSSPHHITGSPRRMAASSQDRHIKTNTFTSKSNLESLTWFGSHQTAEGSGNNSRESHRHTHTHTQSRGNRAWAFNPKLSSRLWFCHIWFDHCCIVRVWLGGDLNALSAKRRVHGPVDNEPTPWHPCNQQPFWSCSQYRINAIMLPWYLPLGGCGRTTAACSPKVSLCNEICLPWCMAAGEAQIENWITLT